MTLSEYDTDVRPHLEFIRSGAQMAARHARQLPVRPNFETKAEADLAETKAVLEAALKDIAAAQASFAGKPLESAS